VLDFVTALWFGIIGACLGSFLNVVAYRMPRGLSVVWKPSHCPHCGHNIRARDNVPVLGWLLLRGRCRDCGEPISARYAIIEAVMGAALASLAYVELFSGGDNLPGGPFTDAIGAWHTVWNPNWTLLGIYAFHVGLLCVLMAMALIDQDKQRIPWSIVLLALVVAFICSWQWRHLYFERARTIRLPEVKAFIDSLAGMIWGASPWIIAMGVATLRGKTELSPRLAAMARAAAVVGAFLGLRAIVRITGLWLAGLVFTLAARPRGEKALSPLAPLWLATFVHLLFWKRLAELVSW
jgi:prepilin signal peptidase PulO-like enzyme (type II secretory pathway)